MAVVEVIHYRTPDYICEMRVFVDGVEVADAVEVTIDPGAGYSLGEWEEHREGSLAGLTPEAHKVAVQWFDSAEDNSEYIGG